ncbi:MAG: hypothetical protein R2692_09435 [Microbacterium sp.]
MVISVILVTFVSLTFVGAAMLMQMQIGKMQSYWAERAGIDRDVSRRFHGHDLRRRRSERRAAPGRRRPPREPGA